MTAGSSTLMFAPAFKPYQTSRHANEHLHPRLKKRKRASADKSSNIRLGQPDIDGDDRFSDQHREETDAPSRRPNSEDSEDGKDSESESTKEYAHGTIKSLRNSSPKSNGLRKQHLAVLMAMLHRCLMEGDYLRAGRAWGMLLRAESHGHKLDVRTYGRWGIGAEILMFRDAQLSLRHQSAAVADGEEEQGIWVNQSTIDREAFDSGSSSFFHHESFRKAIDYYQRLILQYPYRKTMPNTISSLDFYPAMFGLWIYAAQRKYNAILSSSDSGDSLPGANRGDPDEKMQIRHTTFQYATDIATNLDELLVSPPYSDQTRLWRLRGMVAVWMDDLLRQDENLDTESRTEEESPSRDPSAMDQYTEHDGPSENPRRRQRLDVRSKAQEAFQNASRLSNIAAA